jgi:hypothetical protein
VSIYSGRPLEFAKAQCLWRQLLIGNGAENVFGSVKAAEEAPPSTNSITNTAAQFIDSTRYKRWKWWFHAPSVAAGR